MHNAISNVYKNGEGIWFLRLDEKGVGIEIEEKYARAINEFFEDEQIVKSWQYINCHKALLYLIGVITKAELVSNPKEERDRNPLTDFTYTKRAQAISNDNFTFIGSEEVLKGLVETSCKDGVLYVGQILDVKAKELAHSFVMGRETETGRFVCFSKAGFKEYPFTTYELLTLLDFVNEKGEKSYRNQEWRFVAIDNLI